jgi:hypothetical protein
MLDPSMLPTQCKGCQSNMRYWFIDKFLLTCQSLGISLDKIEYPSEFIPDESVKKILCNAKAKLIISDYGPKCIKQGTSFNVQKSGECAIWVEAENATPTTKVVMNETILHNSISRNGTLVTAEIPRELLYKMKSGCYTLYLEDVLNNRSSNKVNFIIN